MNEKMIDGLKAFVEAVVEQTVKELKEQGVIPVIEEVIEMDAPAPDPQPQQEEEEQVIEGAELDLSELGYSDLQKLAKDLGVKAKGSRESIEQAIKESGYVVTAQAVEEEPQEEEIVEEPAVEEPQQEEEEQPAEEVEEGEEAEAYVREVAESLSIEELKDLLTENEVQVKKSNTKKTLVEAVVKAWKEGIIALDDDEEEGEADEPEIVEEEIQSAEVEQGDADEEAEETSAEDDGEEMFEVTPERQKAMDEYKKEVIEAYKDGGFTIAEMKDILKEAGMKFPKMKKFKDEEIIDAYLEYSYKYIDDDGEMHDDSDPYIVDGEPMCCGTVVELDENYKGVCPVCKKQVDFSDEE